MKEIKPIVLKAKPQDNCVGIVRLTPEAEKVARIQRKGGVKDG